MRYLQLFLDRVKMGPVHCALYALLLYGVAAIPRNLLYPFGEEGLDTFLPSADSGSTPEIRLRVPISFFSEKYSTIFVNINGLLSFRTEIPSFINYQFPLDYPIIAPLYTNVDTRYTGSISYRETQDPNIISRATHNVLDSFSNAADFQATSVFIATWNDVGYFRNGTDKVNTFQVVVISNGNDSYCEFLYPEGGIQWIQGTGADSGLPDARAQAGLVNDDGRMYLLRGSAADQIRNVVRWSNMNLPGQWIFHIGLFDENDNIQEPDQYSNNEIETGKIKTCSMGAAECHSKARCVDQDNGYCCVCKDGYYGNGLTCVHNNIPFRVNGKVTGRVNSEELPQLDLQSYIVMADGKVYTAMSHIPRNLGPSFQSVNVIAATLGWLFAKPVGDAKNGYQITGGTMNHTASFLFSTGEKLMIWNKFMGLDVFDSLRLESEIIGNIPIIPDGVEAVMRDYIIEFTITSPGVIQARSTHQLKLEDRDEKISFTIDQSMEYFPCKYAEPLNVTTYKFKAQKHIFSYEDREQLIRYVLNSKVTPLTEIDPCIQGSASCGKNSYCIVEGDNFKCVCQPGYQEIYDDAMLICVDINECQTGTHYCNKNAQCINEEGSFTCECKPGYVGDGRVCEFAQDCAGQCHENGECIQAPDGKYLCQCLHGFAGDGVTCTPVHLQGCDVLNYCSPNAQCIHINERYYECRCLPGYTGDGRICELPEKTTESPTTTTTMQTTHVVEKTTVPAGDYQPLPECNQEGTDCTCAYDWYYDRDSHSCLKMIITDVPTTSSTEKLLACNIINTCHPHAQCIYMSSVNQYKCHCNAGYEGDGYECNEAEASCLEMDICHIHASCQYDQRIGKHACICNTDYEGDGTYCSPIAECSSNDQCEDNADCAISGYSQRYECICHDGYVKNANNVCQPLTGNCGGGTCTDNAQCLFDKDYQTYYCQCNSGYIGDGITECKKTTKPSGCDVENNCGLNANCEYDILMSMYKCKCNDGYFGNGFVCTTERTCDVDPYLCHSDATCILDSNNKNICKCNNGFVGNGTNCKTAPRHEGNFLLLNQGMATLRVPFNPDYRNPGRPIQIHHYQTAIALDIDCLEGKVYWSDIAGHAIKSSDYNGRDPSVFLNEDIGSPEGLSIDWAAKNLFWTDSQKDTIEVANLETKQRKVLFSDGLINPRGIAVHPYRGKVFWSDWNRLAPKLEWANMDGTGREIFLEGDSVKLPNSLAIDWDTDHLCYSDAGTKKIECVNIETRQIYTIATNCSYPFGLAVSNEHFYWTDWLSKSIERVDKATLTHRITLNVPFGGSGKLYDITTVPENCPATYNVCQYSNGQCPQNHLCLPDGKGGRTCTCVGDSCNNL